jgi:hypothetical protein
MRLAFVAMRAFEPLRDREQGHFHIEVMLVSKFTRLRRDVVSARITP